MIKKRICYGINYYKCTHLFWNESSMIMNRIDKKVIFYIESNVRATLKFVKKRNLGL